MTNPSIPKYSVLIIDDELEVLDILEDHINDLGFKVLRCYDPTLALNIVIDHEPELALIISDFKMPQLTGFELRKKILEHNKQIPFLICSSHISREDALKAVELKISGFLEKPIITESFNRIVQDQANDRITQLNDDRELKLGFVVEAENLLEELESLLLDLDPQNNDQETLNRIFAIAHTIKGSSGFFKEDIVNKFTHRFEDFFSPYNKREKNLSPAIIDILLKGADIIKSLVAALKNNNTKNFQLEKLVTLFDLNGNQSISVNADLSLDAKNSNNAPISKNPTAELKSRDEIRVGLGLLDEFSELSGEITVIRNMVNKAFKNIEKEFTGNKNVAHLSELLNEMHKINSSLQEKVVEIRKTPIKNIVKPLQRTVRDLATTLKKKIELEIINDDLRVDTTIAEVLSNSLIHMIRNSVDHGIETPEVRSQNGKDPTGKIILSSREESDQILMELSDDGKGLNTDFLRKKIVEKKLRTVDQAQKMNEKDIWGMIFESGFSTAAVVTDVSGRGVGMDMVKKSIQKVGGRIDIESTLNKGTKFLIYLPVPKSVTIIGSVLVKAGTESYAIAQDSIIRLINLDQVDQNIAIRHIHGADCLLIDNELLPIINLFNAFNTDSNLKNLAKSISVHSKQIVVVKADHLKYAIVVDEILDLEDTVVKKFDAHLKHLHQFAGATFSGEGGVSLILDTVGLAKMFNMDTQIHRINLEASEKNQKDQNEQLLNIAKIRNYLTFCLDAPGHFGVDLAQIYRLEKIKRRDIQMSGEQPVLLYREQIMPLYCLQTIVGLNATNILCDEKLSELSVLVIHHDQRFNGYIVSSIDDLVQSMSEIDPNMGDGSYIAGASIINEATVTIIDIAKLCNKKNQKLLDAPDSMIDEKNLNQVA